MAEGTVSEHWPTSNEKVALETVRTEGPGAVHDLPLWENTQPCRLPITVKLHWASH